MAKSFERTLGPWPAGVDNVHELRELPGKGAVRAAVNIDLTRAGKPFRRKGYAQRSAGYTHSLWSPDDRSFLLMVQGGLLKRVTLDGDTETYESIATVHPTRRMVYAEIAGRVYGSNGIGRFMLDGSLKAWGVEDPGLPAVAAASTGGLDGGTYKVAQVFLSADGEESGCGGSAVVTIATGQGIALSSIPQPISGRSRFYVSRPNGDVLYAAASVPAGVTDYVLGAADVNQAGKQLETQFCERVPPCTILFAYKGRLYFVGPDTRKLSYTLPLWYGLHRRHETFVAFPAPITDAVATNDAIYVGTEKGTFVLSGDDPKAFVRTPIDGFGIIPGTATRLVRGDSVTAAWWSREGVLYRATASGLTAVTRNRLALPDFEFGAVMHRESQGFSQLVSTLRGAQGPNTFAFEDRFDAQVVRNGVTIN